MTPKSIAYFKEFNEAFLSADLNFLSDNLTENVHWRIEGLNELKGKDEVLKVVEEMNAAPASNLSCIHYITHGNKAAINGSFDRNTKTGSKDRFSFCHIYELNKFKNGIVKSITSYIVKTS